MSYSVYVRNLAERDALEAQAWYEARGHGLGSNFNNEFGQALQRLEQMPLIGPQIYGPVRRIVLHRFPYLLWYVVDDQTVIVVACTHGKRSRKFVRSRLRLTALASRAAASDD